MWEEETPSGLASPERAADPGKPVGRQVAGQLCGRREAVAVKLGLLDHDAGLVVKQAAVENEMHDWPGVRAIGLRPVGREQSADRDVQAKLLGHLSPAAGVRRLA